MTKPSTQCCFKIASIALCLELFQTNIIFNFSFSKLISIGSTEPRCHHKTYRYKRQYNIKKYFSSHSEKVFPIITTFLYLKNEK